MPRFRLRPLSLLMAGLTASFTVSAQDSANSSLPTIEVTEILPGSLNATPAAAYRLSDEQLEQLRPYTMHDAFDFVPGVRTIDDDVLGRRSGIGVRGAPSRRSRKTLMLEDGTPINFSSYLDPSTHYTPPMERLETIDVLKGSGHVLHGPLNNHGVVNFRNKQATAEPRTDIEVVLGQQDTFKRHLMHRRTEGGVGLVFSYTGADADGSFDVEDFQYDDFYASADWTINERHDLGASFTYFRERSNYDESNLTPQEYAVAPRTKLSRFGQQHNTFALDYYKADLEHNVQLRDNLRMSNKLFATDADRPRFTTEPEDILVDALPAIVYEDPDDEFIPGEQGTMISRDRYYRTFGGESRMELSDIQEGNRQHTLQWGARFERHLLNDMRSEGEPGEILRESNRGMRTQDIVFQATAFSVFFQDAISQGDWTITPGVRAEYYTQNRDRRVLPADPGPHGPRQTEHQFLVLPSISVLYQGLERTDIFANVARGYTPAFARTADSFPLNPETGINSQFGVRHEIASGLSLESAVFYNHIDDTIVQLPYSIDGMNVVLNSADSRSYGLDLGLRFDSATRYGTTYNVFGELAYNYTHAEFTEDHMGTDIAGNRVPEIPLHAGSLTIGVEHGAGWHASITVSHFGNFYTDPLNTREFVLADEDREPVQPGGTLEIREPAVLGRVPSHTLLSARLGYEVPNSGLAFWLQGRNLSDKLYITDLENGIRPGAERTIVAGMRYNF